MGKSYFISKKKTLKRLPLLHSKNLKGGVVYHDGQFDDARFALALAQTCEEKGGIPLNYFKVTELLKNKDGIINGVNAIDLESGTDYSIRAKAVINATGVFADSILKMDSPSAKKTIRPSQGVHLVLDSSFLQSKTALMIPKTSDGRVLFAIPWYGKVVIGTTDTPINDIEIEPKAMDEEIRFILENAKRYLTRAPKKNEILCTFAGLRPLAAPIGRNEKTKEISRRHKITVSKAGLVSILGGKWTIYRRMAQDTIDKVIKTSGLEKHPCVTQELSLYGNSYNNPEDRLRIYGHHAEDIKHIIKQNPEFGIQLHPAFPYCKAEIMWICKNEMPVELEDILARRTRALILDAKVSAEISPVVATIMAEELEKGMEWKKKQLKKYSELLGNYSNKQEKGVVLNENQKIKTTAI